MEANPLTADPVAETSMSPRTAVVVLVVTLVGLGGTLAYQGWLLQEQTRQLAILETTTQQLRGQNLRISHSITAERTEVSRALRTLQREVATLKSASAGGAQPAAAPAPGAPPGP